MPKKKSTARNLPVFDWLAFYEEQERKKRSESSPKSFKRKVREDFNQAAHRVFQEVIKRSES
jgi:hypothetical protein